MPTGYTAAINDGISFEQFAMTCARAMGALVMMRDEPMNAPIPERFEPSDHHKKHLVRLRDRLATLKAMTPQQAEQEAAAEHARKLSAHEARLHEMNDLREKYEAMLASANGWVPPTPEHADFKAFMVEQLTQSIGWDCDTTYEQAPEKKCGAVWLERELASTLRDIEYHSKQDAEEVSRTEGRNQWLAALRASLKPNT